MYKIALSIVLAVMLLCICMTGLACPPPSGPCQCQGWSTENVSWSGSYAGSQLTSSGGAAVQIAALSHNAAVKILCLPICSNCQPTYSWTITKTPGSGSTEGPWNGTTMPISFTPTGSGEFTVTQNAICGSSACQPCTTTIQTGQVEPPCVQAPAGMIAWWPLDSADMVNPDCQDIVGPYGGHVACGTPVPVPGKVGQACRFTSEVSNLGAIRTPPHLDPFAQIAQGDFTIDAWIYPEWCATCSTIQYHCVNRPIIDNTYAAGCRFLVRNEGWDAASQQWTLMRLGISMHNHDDIMAGVVGQTFLSTTTPIVLNQWQHVAVTVARSGGSSTGTFYYNGSPTGTTFTPTPGNLLDVNNTYGNFPNMDIGHDSPVDCGHCTFTNEYFNGRLDEIEIFNRALDPVEIKAIYDAGGSGKCRESGCACQSWTPGSVLWSRGAVWQGQPAACGSGTVNIPFWWTGMHIVENSTYSCSGGCSPTYSYSVVGPGGPVACGPSTIPGIWGVLFDPAGPGLYTVTENATCGDTICPPCVTQIQIGAGKEGCTPPSINYFTASKTQVAAGEPVTLSWQINGTGSATLNCGGQLRNVDLQGSTVVTPPQSGCCTLTVSNDCGSDKRTVCITCSSPRPSAPVINSLNINCGQATPAGRAPGTCTLTWSVTGPTGTVVTITGIGNVGFSGSTQVPRGGTYTLTATSPGGGSVSQTVQAQ